MKCTLCNNNLNFSIIATSSQMRWNCWGYNKRIIKCNSCGLLFLYPQWTQLELDKLYKDYLSEKDFPGQIQAKRITKYLEKHITKTDTILEIGCGKGENLKYLKFKGYNIIGIEKDAHPIDTHIFNCDYKNLNPKFTKYNFIYSIQVFEHINDPFHFINKIQELLKNKGKFLLEIPNAEEPILSLYKVKNFQKFYNIPHHVYFWTPQTIKLLFNRLGVKIKLKRKQNYGVLNHLRWLLFRKPGNWHPHIPIVDDIYKLVLEKIIRKTDTLIITGGKK